MRPRPVPVASRAVARSEGLEPPSLLIRRECHGFLLPGYMPHGLPGCLSLFRIVCQSFAVWYGQIQTIGGIHGSGGGRSSVRLAAQIMSRSDAWSTYGPRCGTRASSSQSRSSRDGLLRPLEGGHSVRAARGGASTGWSRGMSRGLAHGRWRPGPAHRARRSGRFRGMPCRPSFPIRSRCR